MKLTEKERLAILKRLPAYTRMTFVKDSANVHAFQQHDVCTLHKIAREYAWVIITPRWNRKKPLMWRVPFSFLTCDAIQVAERLLNSTEKLTTK